jgi:hypothetical protein
MPAVMSDLGARGEPAARRDELCFYSVGGVAAASLDEPPDFGKIFGSPEQSGGRTHSSLQPAEGVRSARRRRSISNAWSPSIISPRSDCPKPVAILAAIASR